MSLPPHPFQRRRYWLAPAAPAARAPDRGHGRFGTHVESSLDPGTHLLESAFEPSARPALGAHRLGSETVVSAGVLLDLVCAGAERAGTDAAGLAEVRFESPLVLEAEGGRDVQLVVGPEGWRLSSRAGPGGFQLHAHGRPEAAPGTGAAAPEPWRDLTGAEPATQEAHYDRLARRGIHYDEPLRTVRTLHRSGSRALAGLTPGLDRSQALDACLQTLLSAQDGVRSLVVARIDSVEVAGSPTPAAWAYAAAAGPASGDVALLSADGAVLARLRGVRLVEPPQPLWTESWSPGEEVGAHPEAQAPWLVVGGPEELAERLCAAMGEGAQRARRLGRLRTAAHDAPPGVVLLDGVSIEANGDPLGPLADVCGRVVASAGVPRLVVVTRCGVPASAALHALASVVRAEHPRTTVRVVDVDDPRAPETHLALARELAGASSEPRVAIRNGRRHLPRRVAWHGGAGDPPRWRGAVLITGGLGALGLRVARWAAGRGASDLVLVGRRAPGGSALDVLETIRAGGARVDAVQADVTDRAALAGVLGTLEEEGRRLAAVFHAAGVVDDALLGDTDGDRLRRVLAPKVAGGWNLHCLTRELPLDDFVLFGSVAAWNGLPGQGAYAAANGFADGLAEHRRALGLPAVSIGWCGWEGLGFAATPGGRQALAALEEQGVGALSEAEGLAVLGRLLASDPPSRVAVMPPARQRAPEEAPGASDDLSWRRELSAAGSPGRRRARLDCLVREALAAALHLPAKSIDPDRPFRELGLESLMAVELVERLGAPRRGRQPRHPRGRPGARPGEAGRAHPGPRSPGLRPAPARGKQVPGLRAPRRSVRGPRAPGTHARGAAGARARAGPGALRRRRAPGPGRRLRRRRAALRPLLPARRLPLALHQPARRRVRRNDRQQGQAGGRDRPSHPGRAGALPHLLPHRRVRERRAGDRGGGGGGGRTAPGGGRGRPAPRLRRRQHGALGPDPVRDRRGGAQVLSRDPAGRPARLPVRQLPPVCREDPARRGHPRDRRRQGAQRRPRPPGHPGAGV